jgi:hypothetical protein
MSEQVFRSPGFFEQEIELTAPGAQPTGVPGGLIGAAASGPAFVPTIVASFSDFEARFGGLDPDRPASYAANEWLKNKGALTFIRVLGAGANATTSDFSTTAGQGTVRNAGFKVLGSTVAQPPTDLRKTGAVQFLVARHKLPSDTSTPSEWRGFPVFSDNPSFNPTSNDTINVVRGMLFFPTGARGMVLDMTGAASQWSGTGAAFDDIASTDLDSNSTTYKKFKFVISSSQGATFGTTDSVSGVRILTASFDPNATDYFGKVLNTDPRKFQDEQHLLYVDFPVEDELAPIDTTGDSCIAIASGSNDLFLQKFGRYDTRYTTPRTPAIISQPYGGFEYDLFHFETLTDGSSGNDLFKISIVNMKASTDPKNPYGTFDVLVRDLFDTDTSTKVLESFTGCDLNPNSTNYVAKKIGDRKVTFNFDAADESEQRLLISGKFPNASRRIRVRISSQLDSGAVPTNALPFGFRGVPVVRTTQTLTDTQSALIIGTRTYGSGGGVLPRLACSSSIATGLTGSIVPPLPFRFKATRGTVDGSSYIGSPGILEIPDSRLHWGVKFEKLVPSGTVSGKIENSVMDANAGYAFNPLVLAYSKFQGIQKLDALLTGSDADAFNANKFTLARVALSNQTLSDVTGTIEAHMKEAAYIRNGVPDAVDYRITDSSLSRLTFASLLSGSVNTFNKFSEYAKFSTIFYGGFDGLNVLDAAAARLGDRATSTDTGGLAVGGSEPLARSGLGYDPAGDNLSNNAINSYRVASKLMTDKLTVNVNVIATPGIKEPLITDYITRRLPSYALGMYVLDMPSYTDANVRIFEDSGTKPNVTKTTDALTARAINSNYVATYFPDVFVNDTTTNRKVKVPASVAALGAIGYGDRVSYPWYAPAGFNRAALDFVGNVEVRLSAADRDYLYENSINPIATFPGSGFVIFGQKTLQLSKSAFDRVNVRRLFLELKRIILGVARGLLFEPNDATTRKTFVDRATPLLSLVKAQAGVEQFRIICDDTNNTQADVEASRLNGRIIVVPTRAVEFIAVDFIITPAGVEFV